MRRLLTWWFVPESHHVVHIEGRELPDEDVVVDEFRSPPLALRLVYLVVGLGSFVTALGLMKAGAAELIPALEGSVFTDNAWSTLGVGWLGACIVLSGSPVAASSLTLLDGGAISRAEAFTMLTGSRLGAAFVVLVVGTVYAVRRAEGAGRRAPISIGILSLLVTAVTYVPGAAVGYLWLSSGGLDGFDMGTSPSLTSATDAIFGWAADWAASVLPGWTLSPSAWSCCWWGSRSSIECCPPSASIGWSRGKGRGTRASGRCSLSAAWSAC